MYHKTEEEPTTVNFINGIQKKVKKMKYDSILKALQIRINDDA